jgi:hypothetical protein
MGELKDVSRPREPHPACSPDLAPSNFIPIGYIKGKRSDYNCESRKDFLNVITEIFTGIDLEQGARQSQVSNCLQDRTQHNDGKC